ncbi:MAG: DUF2339 domain-containing protein, partial [Lachnospiraceae bacterium]|nr:DUF2339 domain-containing protein [Lachnospiraceae bacterium]
EQSGMPQFQNSVPQPDMDTPQQASKKKDLENVIGQSWMGIFASVLIFISLILFATVLAPLLTDTIKMAAMYVTSIGFTTFGLIKLQKQKNRTYLAISSCGVGAIYISLLLSHLYFGAIGYIALYVLIFVWAVFVCYLSKLRDQVFQIIGQFGISIALLFGDILCLQTQDSMKLFMLSLFFMLTASVFYVSNFRKEFHKNIVNHIFNCFNVIQLWRCLSSMTDTDNFIILAGVVMVLFLVAQFYFFLISEMKENYVSFSIFTVINTTLLMLFLSEIIQSEDICNGICFIIGCILLVIVDRKYNKKKNAGKNILQIYSILFMWMSVSPITIFPEPINLVFLMLLFLLLGYLREQEIYKYGSLVIFCSYWFSTTTVISYFCLGLLYWAVLVYFMYTKREQYTITCKLIFYIAGLWFLGEKLSSILRNVDLDLAQTSSLVVMGVLNLLAMKSIFIKNFRTLQEEKNSVIVTCIVNAIFMAWNLSAIMEVANQVCHCVLILLAILLFVANTKNLIAKKEGLASGIYIGIKFTVLLVTILSSFDAANYVISVSSFLFAIVSIVVGFRLHLRAFRIYGLILSMLSVIKLIMIDIRYDNTLGHALSFFVSGILCFTISMIYNVIDKKMKEE